ncbi:serine/threonine-protein kinase [Tahibacter soli]|uniref:Serine/threonine-protein kinase n=1 Tax=Tahibacter soli TaxID=2983605 RepID=A0A9X3YJU0_9GAMM|nr:serine/threonine-protein kinase [Tahibacter soli]MDC8013686.1 serine/threonine-protein kinase [Tahibacter soli]
MALRNALELLEASLALPAGERERYVRERAGTDTALCESVLRLLAAHAASDGFLEPAPPADTPLDLGAYRLIERIGAGGMGQVWLARRRDGAFEQQVAIKVLAGTLGDPESIRRAERERQFLAWLEHPHIARVLDGGTTPAGQPYVVMEYVDGRRIDAWCRERALGIEARVALFLDVLSAVDAAHRALIIHRDIKPGNILVDANGRAKLLDFGIAKSLDERMPGSTRTGLVPLTPEYASPEQLLDWPLTTGCDVYALGLLLDELLTGRVLRAGIAITELARRVADETIAPTSARVDAAALGLSERAARDWRHRVAGDLDRVVRKALAVEPERRYGSARAFADDLERWLAHRPVLARGGGAGYRLAKFLRRHRWPVAASAAAALALAAGLGVAALQARRAAQEGDRAQRANRFLVDMIGRANPFYGGKPPLLVDALDRAVSGIDQQLGGQPLLEADVRRAIGDAYLSLERNDAAKEQLDRAARLRATDGGPGYSKVLGSQAQLEWRLGRYADAERLYRLALTHSGGDAAQRSEVLNDLSALLGDVGRYAEALPLAQEALRIKDALPDVAPRERMVNLSNVANALDGLQRFDESYAAYRQAIAIGEAMRPQPELDLGITLNNLAYLQDEMGRLEESAATQERAVALYRKIMGPDYPRLAVQLSNLALRYSKLGRHDEAMAATADALRLAPGAYDTNDQKYANLLVAAARVALARGDAAEAASRAQAAIAIYDGADMVEAGRRDKAQALLDDARAKLGAPAR